MGAHYAVLLIGVGAAFAAEKELTVPTADGPVRATVMPAQGDAPRLSVLLLHGRDASSRKKPIAATPPSSLFRHQCLVFLLLQSLG
jgi:hypothetical protein